jgi:competence protein ComEA
VQQSEGPQPEGQQSEGHGWWDAPVGELPSPDEREADEEAGLPPPLPRPGRHAARRAGRGLAGLLPETVRGRFALGPPQLALVAVLVAAGLAATTWWVVRADSRPVAAPPGPQPVPGLATPAAQSGEVSPGPGAASAPSGRVTVDVAGKVRRPGIVVLDTGARVVDALEAAGGARPGVDLTSLNLARVLVDGEQILVGTPAVPGVAAAAPVTPGTGPLVDLNTADAATLETLPDVGPVTAEAIIAWRTEHGGFTAVEELLEVDGIGEATLETLAPHVTV